MRKIFLLAILFACTWLSACDKNRLLDESREIPAYAWHYRDQVGFDVLIEDTSCFYNIYINNRIRSDYKYNNMFVLLHTQLPDKKDLKQRFEFHLADERGKWLGKGLGDIYSYQHLIVKNAYLGQKGIYRFAIEQNMRDDTLANVVSVGMRIEKGDPRF